MTMTYGPKLTVDCSAGTATDTDLTAQEIAARDAEIASATTAAAAQAVLDGNRDTRRSQLATARAALRQEIAGTSTLTAAQYRQLSARILLRLVNEAISDNQATD